MRTLLLIALGGGLLYFTLFRGDDVDASAGQDAQASTSREQAPSGGGRFMTQGPRTGLTEGSGGALGGTDPGTSAPHPSAPEVPDLEDSASARRDRPAPPSDDLPDLDALGNPLAEGELMAHDVGRLQAYLRGEGSGLSTHRRNLLISYGLLIRGMPGQVDKYARDLEGAEDITSEEWNLLASARAGGRVRARTASANLRSNPLVLGASMGLMAAEGERLLREQAWRESAEVFSELLLAEIDAPWEADREALEAWSKSLASAQANHRWNREGKWPSTEVEVRGGDTLVGIRKRVLAERPRMNLCTGLIHRSNQLGQYLREGEVLRIPTDPAEVIVDLSARWLFYLQGGEVVGAWPVAIGRVGEETRPGSYLTGEKIPEPPWFPEGRNVVPYGDSENPLGTRWIGLENSGGLGIHGTWEPGTIGSMASDGCVRMRNDAVEELFEILPKGSPVLIRP